MLPQLQVDKEALAELKTEYLRTWFQPNPPDSVSAERPFRDEARLSRRSKRERELDLTDPKDRPRVSRTILAAHPGEAKPYSASRQAG